MRLGGIGVKYGMRLWHGLPLAAYCQPEAPIPRAAMVSSLIAPQILVPAMAVFLGMLWPAFSVFVIPLIAINALGGIGDLLALVAILRSPYAMFIDKPDGLWATN